VQHFISTAMGVCTGQPAQLTMGAGSLHANIDGPRKLDEQHPPSACSTMFHHYCTIVPQVVLSLSGVLTAIAGQTWRSTQPAGVPKAGCHQGACSFCAPNT
jgi:hypothetical protein